MKREIGRLAFFSLFFILIVFYGNGKAFAGNYMRWFAVWGYTGSYGDANYLELPGADGVLGTSDDRNVVFDCNSWDGGGEVQKFFDQHINGAPYNGTLWYMILSHPHTDHYYGLNNVLSNYSVKYFYENENYVGQAPAAAYTTFKNNVNVESGITINYLNQGDYLATADNTATNGPDWDGGAGILTVRVCVARKPYDSGDPNANSLVIKFYLKSPGETTGSSFILGGDAPSDTAEADAVTDAINNGNAFYTIANTDIVKANHHGSTTSNSMTWLNKCLPKYIIEEVVDAQKSHPTSAALENFRTAGANIYRIDLDKGVTVYADGAGNYNIGRTRAWIGGDTGASGATAAPVWISTPPSVPSGLSIAYTATSATLTWTANPAGENVDRYIVFRATIPNGDGGAGRCMEPDMNVPVGIYKRIGTTTGTSYTDNNLDFSTPYYYRITADNNLNYERRYSNEVERPGSPDFDPPFTITDLTALPGADNGEIKLTWTAPFEDWNSATSGAVQSYTLKYATYQINAADFNGANTYSQLWTPASPHSMETKYLPGFLVDTTYWFALKSQDLSVNVSSMSAAGISSLPFKDAIPPVAITTLIATIGVSENTIDLSWLAPGNDGTSGTLNNAQFRIQYASHTVTWGYSGTEGNTAVIPVSGAAPFSLQQRAVTGLPEWTTYYFRIWTFDGTNNWSQISNGATAFAQIDIIPPAPVSTLLAATGQNPGEIALSWTSPGNDGTAGTLNNGLFHIQYASSAAQASASFWNHANAQINMPVNGAVLGTSFTNTVTGLIEGNTYYFRIWTADKNSNWSQISNGATAFAQIDIIPPAPPQTSDTKTEIIQTGAPAAITIAPLSGSGDIKVEVPANTFAETVNMTVKIPDALPDVPAQPELKGTNIAVEIKLDKPLEPAAEISVTISYRDSDVSGLDESKLVVTHYDQTRLKWIVLTTTVHTDQNKVTAKTKHLSLFRIMQLTPSSDLAGSTVYPNPFKPSEGHTKIWFTKLVPGAETRTRIFNVAGELVFDETKAAPAGGEIEWSGKNSAGVDVASGIYIYLISNDRGQSSTGKMAIIR